MSVRLKIDPDEPGTVLAVLNGRVAVLWHWSKRQGVYYETELEVIRNA
jgi:hypothetical protein